MITRSIFSTASNASHRTSTIVRQDRLQGKGMASCLLNRSMTRSIFFSQPRNECVAENANDGPPRLSRSQGKGNRLTISRMIDDFPPASFEKCGDEHHSNRKEKTLLPAPGMTARGQLASLPPQVRAGSRKVRTDLPRRFATAASIDQILKSCFLLWSCRFRRVCVAFSSCCGAFVGSFVCLVSRVSPCWFLRT